MSSQVVTAPGGLFGWWHEATPGARRALVAASLGWMLDSFDVMLYSLVLAYLMADLAMSTTTAGLLGSLALLASAAGGMIFGFIMTYLFSVWMMRPVAELAASEWVGC